jgi:hypothetical protein
VHNDLLSCAGAQASFSDVAPFADEPFGENAAVAIGDCASQLCSLAYSFSYELTSHLERDVIFVVLAMFNNVGHFTGVRILRTGKLLLILARRVCLP